MDFLDYTDLQNEVEITDSASKSRAAVPVSLSATATPAPLKDSMLALAITQNLCFVAAVRADPTSQAVLLDCLAAAKAKGTVTGYSITVRNSNLSASSMDMIFRSFRQWQ
jgi:hypothetical protein